MGPATLEGPELPVDSIEPGLLHATIETLGTEHLMESAGLAYRPPAVPPRALATAEGVLSQVQAALGGVPAAFGIPDHLSSEGYFSVPICNPGEPARSQATLYLDSAHGAAYLHPVPAP